MSDKTRQNTVSDVVLAGDATTVGPGGGETVAGSPWPRYAQPELGEFGDYELLAQLGEGGMGIVYRARQKAANRIVALKVVHTNRAGSARESTRAKALQRFRIEAQAAAQLEHENIVPVYDVGEIGENVYFSMRLVDGPSLNDVVRMGPLEPKRAARYMIGVARGVAQAHKQGILHRDLKPHNVMLDSQNDRPLVADFGLAKVVQADDQVTRDGEVIGTPSYMPPEQISSAAQVDARADIYALGATLYHLLVGKPPFQAANTLATMRQVLFQEPAPPQELNVAVDRDLDTICIKCLQKEPAKRYQTADDLADDLQRYVEGKPILARPVSLPERTWRWCKRNPLAAGLSGLAAALAVGVFIATAMGYRSTRAALAKSERHFTIARESVDELYGEVSAIDLENAPGMQPLKEKLLTRSLSYYERLLAEHEGDVTLTADMARHHFHAGTIKDQLGDSEAAAGHYREAEGIQAALLAATPGDRKLQLALSDTWNELGRLSQRSGDLPAAKKAFGRAEELRAKLATADPKDVEIARKLANVRMNLGLLAVREERFDDAQSLYDQAQLSRTELLAGDEGEAHARVVEDLAKGYFNQGTLADKRGDRDSAIASLRKAAEHFSRLLVTQPDSLKYRYRLAMAQATLADLLQLAGQVDLALDQFGAAQANLQTLVDENPLVDDFQSQLTTMQIGQAQLALRLGHEKAKAAVAAGDEQGADAAASKGYYEQARATLRQAEARLRRLAERNPDVATHKYNLAVTLQMLGDVELAFRPTAQEPALAKAYFVEALKQVDAIPAEAAATPAFEELRRSLQQSLDEADAGS